jgi:hypothetical protein
MQLRDSVRLRPHPKAILEIPDFNAKYWLAAFPGWPPLARTHLIVPGCSVRHDVNTHEDRTDKASGAVGFCRSSHASPEGA